MRKKLSAILLALVFPMVLLADISIVTQDVPTSAEIFAAQDLAEHLRKITGQEIRIVDERNAAGTPSIYVGNTKLASEAIKTLTRPEEWLIQSVDDKTLILAGHDDSGTINSVYTFLERFGNVLWFDEKNCVIPENREFRLPKVKMSGAPAMRVRRIYDSMDHYEGTIRFKMRNRSQAEGRMPLLGDSRVVGSPGPHHTFHNYADAFPEKSDELFALSATGERPRDASGQLCMTNPKTREYVLQALRKFIVDDRENAKKSRTMPPVIYDISQNDNPHYCTCPACKAIAEREGGTYAAPLLDFINYIAREIHNEYPDVFIRTFAYLYSYEPPKTMQAEKNVIIHLAMLGSEFGANGKRNTMRPLSHPDNAEAMRLITGWGRHCSNLAVWDYWKLFGNDHSFMAAPYVNIDAIVESMAVYQKNNVHDLFVELESPESISFFGLKRYLGMRLMEDPTRNPAVEIDAFMKGMYGAGSPFMREFLKFISQEQDKVDYHLAVVSPHLREFMDGAYFKRSFELLDQAVTAVKKANDTRCQENIEREYVPVYAATIRRYWRLSAEDQKMFDYGKLLLDYEKAINASIDYYFPQKDDRMNMNSVAKNRLSRTLFILREEGKSLPVPEEFSGRKVKVLPFYKFNQKYTKLIVAPDSLYGKAVSLDKTVPGKTRDGITAFGIWDAVQKAQLCNAELKSGELPQDEKFHLVHLGKARFRNSSPYFWGSCTWQIQCTLEDAFEPTASPEDNTYDVYFSVKFAGKPYVINSEQDGVIAVDALFLVQ